MFLFDDLLYPENIWRNVRYLKIRIFIPNLSITPSVIPVKMGYLLKFS